MRNEELVGGGGGIGTLGTEGAAIEGRRRYIITANSLSLQYIP